MTSRLDVLASGFTFVGSVVLALDALFAKQTLTQRRGLEKLVGAASDAGEPALFRRPDGRPLSDGAQVDEWIAARSSHYGLWGFILVAVGFALDLISKLLSSSCSTF